jgi:hypothetical protein
MIGKTSMSKTIIVPLLVLFVVSRKNVINWEHK